MTEIPEGRCCVYQHIRPDTNLPFYIGIGKSRGRPGDRSSRSLFWKKIVAKNNGIYKIEYLYRNVSDEFAKQEEIRLIKLYGRVDIGTGILCNMTDGGDGVKNISEDVRQKMRSAATGRVHSEETRRKLSIINKGRKTKPPTQETRSKISSSQIGKIISNETKEKQRLAAKAKFKKDPTVAERIRATLTGSKWSESNFQKSTKWLISQVDMKTGMVIGRYRGSREAEEATGVGRICINNCCLQKRPEAGGFYWIGEINPEYTGKFT